MDAAKLQERLYKGYGQMAKRVGQLYDVYRSPDGMDPLASGNLIASLHMAIATRTRPFEVPAQFKDAVWMVFIDGRELQPRDFLAGPYGTWYIADMQPELPIQAVRCNHTVSIGRPEFAVDDGALEQSLIPIASALPVFTQLKRVDIKQPAFGSSTAGQAITHWTAFIPMAQGAIKQHDLVTDDEGVKYELDAPDFTNMGYVTSIRLAQQ